MSLLFSREQSGGGGNRLRLNDRFFHFELLHSPDYFCFGQQRS